MVDRTIRSSPRCGPRGARTLLGGLAGAALIAAALSFGATPLQGRNQTSVHRYWDQGAPTRSASVELTGFTPTLGATRVQVEAIFHYIDGSHTSFSIAKSVKGVPRVLGADKRLFTVVEINGNPEVSDVQVVSILDTSSKTILEDQVTYDALTCGEFSTTAAQTWCTSRILNTNAKGLLTATASKTFGGLLITVRTYRSSTRSTIPIVSIDINAA